MMWGVPEGHQWGVQDVGPAGRPLDHAQGHHPIESERCIGIPVAFTAADGDEDRIAPLPVQFFSDRPPSQLQDIRNQHLGLPADSRVPLLEDRVDSSLF